MDRLGGYLVIHPHGSRALWMLVMLVLAACNNGSDGGGPRY